MWFELLSIFAVWRLTSMIQSESGPGHIFTKLRKQLRKDGIDLLDCFWCTSVWVAIPFALFTDYTIIAWLGLSGLAIMVNEIIETLNPGT